MKLTTSLVMVRLKNFDSIWIRLIEIESISWEIIENFDFSQHCACHPVRRPTRRRRTDNDSLPPSFTDRRRRRVFNAYPDRPVVKMRERRRAK